jgi:hypothetical protein
MKRNRWLTCMLFGVMLILLQPRLLSSQAHPTHGTIDVPFDFYISGTKLPAGQYMLDIVAPTYVLLRSKDGKVQQDLYFLQTAVPGKNPSSKVIFAMRDGKYYFSEIWSWRGKSQLSTFTPNANDQTKEVPLVPVEKDVAKPAPGL